MLFQKLRRSLCHVSLFAFFVSIIAPTAANAISITRTLNWTGDSGSTLTGTFTGEDDPLNPDGIIQAVSSGLNGGTGINEFSILNVTFLDNQGNPPVFYDVLTLLGFQTLNFNYDIASGTILQSLNPTDLLQGTAPSFSAGLFMGDDSTGFTLQSNSGSVLTFTDNINSNNDTGGTLTATAVPFEFDASAGILTLGAIWGANQWRKHRLKK